jgi:phosphatidylglycerophosphatase A
MAAIETTVVTRQRPDLSFLLAHPAHLIALGLGSGLLRPGPGTWGTLFAWLLFSAVDALFDPSWQLLMLIGLAGLGAGTWAAHRTGIALGVADAGQIVIDEIVAFWCLLALLPAGGRSWPLQMAAFVLFRLFDIVKPPPIGSIDRGLRNAAGVMLDDLVAALYAWVVLRLWVSFL